MKNNKNKNSKSKCNDNDGYVYKEYRLLKRARIKLKSECNYMVYSKRHCNLENSEIFSSYIRYLRSNKDDIEV